MPQRDTTNAGTVFDWPVRIYYEDTDASGVVYHAQYLKYFERARTEWLRTLGFGQTRLAAELGVAFTVASAELAFRQPAQLDDELRVTVDVTGLRRVSLAFEQTMLRDSAVIATGRFRIACVDAVDFRPCAIPEYIRQEMQ